LENVHFRRLVEPRIGHVALKASVSGTRCTFEGLDLKITGSATWESSLLSGQPSEAGATGADLEALWKLAPPSYQTPPS
jgi:hypothetical protein